jgi:hypothetical protein
MEDHHIQLYRDKAYLDLCRFVYSTLHYGPFAEKLTDAFILKG